MKKMSLIPDGSMEYVDLKTGATAVIWGLPKKGKGTMKVQYQYLDGEERNEYKLVSAGAFRQMFKLKVRVVK